MCACVIGTAVPCDEPFKVPKKRSCNSQQADMGEAIFIKRGSAYTTFKSNNLMTLITKH